MTARSTSSSTPPRESSSTSPTVCTARSGSAARRRRPRPLRRWASPPGPAATSSQTSPGGATATAPCSPASTPPWTHCSPAATATSSARCSTSCGWSRTRGRSPGCSTRATLPLSVSPTSPASCPSCWHVAASAESAGSKARSGDAPGWKATRSATRRSSALACTARPCTGGAWTPDQLRIYRAVYEAQSAGIAEVKAGADFLAAHNAAMWVLADHLHSWGILPVTAEVSCADDPERPGAGLHRRYTLHGTSHMLGIDVHDCALAREQNYRKGTLAAGYVLTVEPGLYFQPNDRTVPAELRGLAVRIEDDILVTDGDPLNLSGSLPRDADEVTAW